MGCGVSVCPPVSLPTYLDSHVTEHKSHLAVGSQTDTSFRKMCYDAMNLLMDPLLVQLVLYVYFLHSASQYTAEEDEGEGKKMCRGGKGGEMEERWNRT